MNWGSWLLWGMAATVVLTTISAAAQGLGLTRMNLPYMLGTLFTPDRDKAKLYGFMLHLVIGLMFSWIYVLIFESMGAASWWRGVLLGVLHALFMLIVLMAILPGLHPRMASEQFGPTSARMLEPPGFLALNYGIQTPVAVLIAHIVFGAILGGFYHL
jgi:hypothetical protein